MTIYYSTTQKQSKICLETLKTKTRRNEKTITLKRNKFYDIKYKITTKIYKDADTLNDSYHKPNMLIVKLLSSVYNF